MSGLFEEFYYFAQHYSWIKEEGRAKEARAGGDRVEEQYQEQEGEEEAEQRIEGKKAVRKLLNSFLGKDHVYNVIESSSCCVVT